ncbi:MAG TPA: DUF1553 domain-containing protein [Candidatus Brocadiia bacterium]|nr:DUF1553 domain-containing protein [Candidatus Brocadiia bacterium]
MTKALLCFALALLPVAARAGEPPAVVHPYETDVTTAPSPLDGLVLTALKKQGIEPARLCSDAVFIRRVYLDVTGELPGPEDVRAFLKDRGPGKRAALIDELLARDVFADMWAMKWCDLLRVKAEYPVNVWPNAAQAFHRWIRDQLRANRPYDQFAREMLTASGSNFRVAAVNFYRAIQGRTPAAMADAAALTFMGARAGAWPEARRAAMAVFFSRVMFKPTAEWKEEIVCLDPAPAGPLVTTFPDGQTARIAADEDPRRVFADWLISPSNPWFGRNIVNRVWAWLLGRGIIHEPDDIRPDNPPSNPELLAYLESELAAGKYDLRRIYRLILNSRTYQQSPIPRSSHPDAERLFAFYKVRRLDAEALSDMLRQITGGGETYSSPIPEPFTFIPGGQRAVELADGSITSPFLELFGRPARDTGLESERDNNPSPGQRLFLINSAAFQRRIERSGRLRAVIDRAKGDRLKVVDDLYLTILSRLATPAEIAALRQYAAKPGLGPGQAVQDLVWALINSREFLYRH